MWEVVDFVDCDRWGRRGDPSIQGDAIERLAASMDRVLVSIPEHFSPSYF